MSDKDMTPEAHTGLENATKAGGVKFLPIYMGMKDGEAKVVHISEREERVIKTFLSTLSHKACAQEIGVNVNTIRRYLQRANVKAVIDQAAERAAIRTGTDLDEMMVWLRKARDGDLENEPKESKVLKPAGAGIQINNNIMAGNHFESPYKGLSAEDLMKSLKERLDAGEGGSPSGT